MPLKNNPNGNKTLSLAHSISFMLMREKKTLKKMATSQVMMKTASRMETLKREYLKSFMRESLWMFK